MAASSVVEQQRSEPRLTASLPIMVEWQTQTGVTCRARGTTHDIALGGVYCYLEQPLAAGVWARFHIALLGELPAGDPVNLRCTGHVLRCENLDRQFGIAISIEVRQPIANQLPASKPNRRCYIRIPARTRIPVVCPDPRARIRDLSLASAYVENDRPLPVGRAIDLHLGDNGVLPRIPVKALVRRTEPPIGMAVEFVVVTKEASYHLQNFLERCSHGAQIASWGDRRRLALGGSSNTKTR
jgi:hypothetical protein